VSQGIDSVSYRTGFEDCADVIFSIISAEEKVPKAVKENLLAFILSVRQAKAEGIVADLEIYRSSVRVLIGAAARPK
jgi:hypothetical protein